MSALRNVTVKKPGNSANDWPLQSPNASEQTSPVAGPRKLNGTAGPSVVSANGDGKAAAPDSTPARKLPVEPMPRKVLRTVRMLITFALIIGGFLILNIYQALAFITLKPFSSVNYRKANSFLCGSFVRSLMLLMDRLSGNTFYVSGDESFWTEPQRSSILMANHISYGDWPVMFMIAYRAGVAGWLRVVLKDVGKYMPGLGWACWFHEFLFLRRAWDQDAGPMTNRIGSFVKERTPLWIMIFPEGTFTDLASPQIVHDAHSFSDKAGIPRRDHTLIPRVKGFSVLRNAGPDDYLSRVVDVTLVFTGQTDPTYCHPYSSQFPLLDRGRVLPDVLSFLNAQAPDVHVHIRVFETRDLPTAEPDLKRWLFDRFAEKEQLIANFHATGEFVTGKPAVKRPLDLPILLAHQFGWFAAAFVAYTALGAVLPAIVFKSLVGTYITLLVLATGVQALMR